MTMLGKVEIAASSNTVLLGNRDLLALKERKENGCVLRLIKLPHVSNNTSALRKAL